MCTLAVQTQQPVRGEALRGAVKGQKEFQFFLYTGRPTWRPEALCPPRASPSSLQPPSASQTSGTLPTLGTKYRVWPSSHFPLSAEKSESLLPSSQGPPTLEHLGSERSALKPTGAAHRLGGLKQAASWISAQFSHLQITTGGLSAALTKMLCA